MRSTQRTVTLLKLKISGIVFFTLSIMVNVLNAQQIDLGPKLIGSPLKDAFNSMVKLRDGEIRLYKWNQYVKTIDGGITWDTVAITNEAKYGRQSPISNEFYLLGGGNGERTLLYRSEGIDEVWTKNEIAQDKAIMIKPVVFVNEGKRILAGFSTKYRNGCAVYYSDDQGDSWSASEKLTVPRYQKSKYDKGKRWDTGAVEPTIVELNDGRLWMIMRTPHDKLYESYSYDFGTTWTGSKPSRFYGSNTMSTIQRLSSGKLIFIWNNTMQLPELQTSGSSYREDVFTNRDAMHIAISDDDGKTWSGFRELILNPHRNDSLMATMFGTKGDLGVHQSEVVSIDEKNIMVSLGQNTACRSIVRLNEDWLFEKERYDDFSLGLTNWSYQLYKKGIKGHCAYNRVPGAILIENLNDSKKNTMYLSSNTNSDLLYPNSGATWNFPAGSKGEINLRIKASGGFDEIDVSLTDRWFNPVDTTTRHYASYSFNLTKTLLKNDEWVNLKFEWENADVVGSICVVSIDEQVLDRIPLENVTINGISYIHFSLSANNKADNGVFIDHISSKVN